MPLPSQTNHATVFTDGSCNTHTCLGAWASIIFIGKEKITLSGIQENTTHNRMEIEAAIRALDFLRETYPECLSVTVISDSQYVVNLDGRKAKLIQKGFLTNSGKPIQNVDLVQKIFHFDSLLKVQYEKIKAHQQQTENDTNYNIEVDKIARALVRKTLAAT
jgi:ribonuclease HI